jgi:hypothetical protein
VDRMGKGMKIKGTISFYGIDPSKEHLNEFTASGQKFNPMSFSCALPKSIAESLGIYRSWGKLIRVTHLRGVEHFNYNDTGPAERMNRICDLTPAGFSFFSQLNDGLLKDAEIEVV